MADDLEWDLPEGFQFAIDNRPDQPEKVISVPTKLWRPWVADSVGRLNEKFPRCSWGTYPGHDPSEADAADGMIPNWSTPEGHAYGTSLANYVARQAFCKAEGIWYVIHYGRIWSMTRPSSGWLPYFDRNNPNPSRSHKNHGHISWYFNKKPTPVTPPTPAPKPYEDGWHPDLPWIFYLDKQDIGVTQSTSVWLIQKALGLKPYDGNYTVTVRDAVQVWQRDVAKDDPKLSDGILGPRDAAMLFGPDVAVQASSA